MSRQLCSYAPGEVLFQEGEPSGGLYFIQSGKIEVFRCREGTKVVLGKLGPGEILGTLTVFSGEPRTASARATTRVEAQYMSSASLSSGLNNIPVWAVAIIKDTIARLKHVDGLLVESAINEKKQRSEQGSALHHGAQLAQFCALMIRLQTREDDGVQVWPAAGLAARAESVLNLRAEYLELLWSSFVAGGLAKPLDDKKWGKVIRNPRPSVFENFGVFGLRAAKKEPPTSCRKNSSRLPAALCACGKSTPIPMEWPRAHSLKVSPRTAAACRLQISLICWLSAA